VPTETFDHLRFARLDPVNQKRKRGRPPPVSPPEDPKAHATKLLEELERTAREAQLCEPGFDPRLLVKLNVEGIAPDELTAIGGLQLVSQEKKALVVAFVDEKAKLDFEQRLRMVTRGESPSRKDVLFAIKSFESWHREDRIGPAIEREGFPESEPFLLDVELWALEMPTERSKMVEAFKAWCSAHNVAFLDQLVRESVVLVRVNVTRAGANAFLDYRDVRMVDLPPRVHLDLNLLKVPLQTIAPVGPPPENAPRIGVLDSGAATGHPLLGPAIGDADSFIPGKGAADENGHGTMVAGLALYGDVAAAVARKEFVPQLRLVSGRITNENNETEGLVEKQLVEAVETFVRDYGCRVFNLSIGNERNPYLSGHIGPWAAIVDELAHLHRVLFVISAGNFEGTEHGPTNWLTGYPEYLLSDDAKIIDPAPALNALTVGSIARHEQSRMAARYPKDPAYRSIAKEDEPSPFTRSGPSIGGAIKPELVEYGGNWHVDARVHNARPAGDAEIGELSTSWAFFPELGGNLFAVGAGTSYSAPRVTWLAGMLLRKYPTASANLLRALLVAHARVPDATRLRLGKGHEEEEEERVLRLVGYGRPTPEAALSSTESRVTLIAEGEIQENHCHFYEVPLPTDFLKDPRRRARRITVSLAHTPLVRRTRLDYKGSEFSFRVVREKTAERVFELFKRAEPNRKQEKLKKEVGDFRPTSLLRSNGTTQAATWKIGQLNADWEQQKLFVVVTRSVPGWATEKVPVEPYALCVVLEDLSQGEVRLYTQIRERVRERARVRP
jgi:hypothetical protein